MKRLFSTIIALGVTLSAFYQANAADCGAPSPKALSQKLAEAYKSKDVKLYRTLVDPASTESKMYKRYYESGNVLGDTVKISILPKPDRNPLQEFSVEPSGEMMIMRSQGGGEIMTFGKVDGNYCLLFSLK